MHEPNNLSSVITPLAVPTAERGGQPKVERQSNDGRVPCARSRVQRTFTTVCHTNVFTIVNKDVSRKCRCQLGEISACVRNPSAEYYDTVYLLYRREFQNIDMIPIVGSRSLWKATSPLGSNAHIGAARVITWQINAVDTVDPLSNYHPPLPFIRPGAELGDDTAPDPCHDIFVLVRPFASARVHVSFRAPGTKPQQPLQLNLPISSSISDVKAALLVEKRSSRNSCQRCNVTTNARPTPLPCTTSVPSTRGESNNRSASLDTDLGRSNVGVTTPYKTNLVGCSGGNVEPAVGESHNDSKHHAKIQSSKTATTTADCRLIFRGRTMSDDSFLLGDYLLSAAGRFTPPTSPLSFTILVLWRHQCCEAHAQSAAENESSTASSNTVRMSSADDDSSLAVLPTRRSARGNNVRWTPRRSVQRCARSVVRYSGLARGPRCGLGIQPLLMTVGVVGGGERCARARNQRGRV